MALTNAERQRRYIARLKANAAVVSGSPVETPKQRALNKAWRDGYANGYETAAAVFSETTLSVGTIGRVIEGLIRRIAISKPDNGGIRDIKAAVLAGDDKALKRELRDYVDRAIARGAWKLGYVQTRFCTISIERMARPATLESDGAEEAERLNPIRTMLVTLDGEQPVEIPDQGPQEPDSPSSSFS